MVCEVLKFAVPYNNWDLSLISTFKCNLDNKYLFLWCVF